MGNYGSYFYLPKEIMTSEFDNFTTETKMLFAILLTNCSTAKSITNIAELINVLGEQKINSLCKAARRANAADSDLEVNFRNAI